MKRFFGIAALLILIFPGIAAEFYRLPEIEIKVSSIIDSLSDSSAIFRIHKEENSDINTSIIQQAFIKFRSYGVNNSLSTININGISAAQNKVMIEGIALNSPQNGYANLSVLPAELIDRVEILFGPQGSIAGNNSIGGVVNFLFDMGEDTKPYTMSVAIDNWNNYFFTYKHVGLCSFGLFYNFGKNAFGYRDLYGQLKYREENAFKKSSFYTKVGNIFFMNNYLYSQDPGPTYSPNSGAFQVINNTFFKVNYRKASLSFSNFYNEYQNLKFSYGPVNDLHNFSILSFDVQDSNTLGVLKMYHAFKDNFSIGESTKLGYRRQNELLIIERWRLPLARNINMDLAGGATYTTELYYNYKLQLTSLLFQNTSFIATYSSGYRLPTYNDLFWPESGFAKGNTELRPEYGRGGEVRITNNLFLLRGYYYIYKDLIKWQPNPVKWMPVNLARVRSYGFDWNIKYKLGRLAISVGYSYNQTMDLDLEKYIVYIPQEKMVGAIKYKGRRWFNEIRVRYEGFRYTNTSNTTYLDEFLLVDLNLGFSFGAITFVLEVDNVLDESFQYIKGYPQPLRTIKVKMNYKF